MTTNQATRLDVLDLIADTGGPLDTCRVALVKEAFDPISVTSWADLTEADFTGYARSSTLSWNSAYVDPAGRIVVSAPSVHFEATGGATPNTIYGAAIIVPGTPPVLRGCALFSSPIPIEAADQGIDVLPELVYGG